MSPPYDIELELENAAEAARHLGVPVETYPEFVRAQRRAKRAIRGSTVDAEFELTSTGLAYVAQAGR